MYQEITGSQMETQNVLHFLKSKSGSWWDAVVEKKTPGSLKKEALPSLYWDNKNLENNLPM